MFVCTECQLTYQGAGPVCENCLDNAFEAYKAECVAAGLPEPRTWMEDGKKFREVFYSKEPGESDLEITEHMRDRVRKCPPRESQLCLSLERLRTAK